MIRRLRLRDMSLLVNSSFRAYQQLHLTKPFSGTVGAICPWNCASSPECHLWYHRCWEQRPDPLVLCVLSPTSIPSQSWPEEAFTKIAPALIAGNCITVKSSFVPNPHPFSSHPPQTNLTGHTHLIQPSKPSKSEVSFSHPAFCKS